ncbi:hypothetical protein M408DRAFT_76284 [Serendipita vermifera MAFF 305830]|uniref:DNA replication regulator SLD2 n=1 Tax=Serendipita vermifera MAFF 305830 TaxID=933852 RepID=A0A0C3AHL6_SERVB|nr:hypothetical protein M408DRAFT_76284 [Serendipita vermifera MAFF 305830]
MSAEYTSLRGELKQWEKNFQAEHGRKATPDDIRLVPGLAEKYKRFKLLSKSSTQQGPPPASKGLLPSKPIIVHSKPTENERDPLPPSARPNPFSPVKKTTESQPARPNPSSEFRSFPDLLASPTKRTSAGKTASPPGSPNPFLATALKKQPDSPFTAARKRIRGEGESEELMDSILTRPDKKRRSTMNRSISASTTAAPGLFASGSDAYRLGNLFGPGSTSVSGTEVLEESPVKQSTLNGAVYKPIFDDDDMSSNPTNTSMGTTARTVSLPVAPIFGRRIDSQSAAQTSRAADAESASQPSQLNDEDEQMDEDEPTRNEALLAPTPVKGDKNNRWKGKPSMKSKRGKAPTVSTRQGEDEESENDESHESELSVTEVGWRIMGPLHTGAFANDRDEEMEDADDENFQLPPIGPRWALSRRFQEEEDLLAPEEPENIEVDVTEEMKEILQLSPTKRRSGEATLVQDILSGKGDRTKRAEVWLPGDVGEESDEWESEGAGWWEAEL